MQALIGFQQYRLSGKEHFARTVFVTAFLNWYDFSTLFLFCQAFFYFFFDFFKKRIENCFKMHYNTVISRKGSDVFLIIDAHAHIFPEKIAVKSSQSISDFYQFPYRVPAAASELLTEGNAAGIGHFLVCSVAVTPAQTPHINDFLTELCNKVPSFTPLAAVHPDYADYEAELDRAKALGCRGVKLHPDFQKFYIDDAAYLPFFAAIAKRNLPILMHMGDARYQFSEPKRLAHLMRQVPDLVVTAAHFGGYSAWDQALKDLPICENIWFDTSSSLAFLSRDDALRLLAHFGTQRFLFGTDFPIWDPKQELERFHRLGLTPAEEQGILCDNFCRLYHPFDT